MSGKGTECECHKVDWTGGPGNYTVIETGEALSENRVAASSPCCQDKVNGGIMSFAKYEETCKFIPGKQGTLFPASSYAQLLGDLSTNEEETSPPTNEEETS